MATNFFRRFRLDFWICAFLFLSAGWLFADSRGMPDKAVLFPSLTLAAIMALSVYCMAASVLKQRKPAQEPVDKPGKALDRRAVFLFGAMVAVYAITTPVIGFGLASLLFISGGSAFFGERNKIALAVVPLATMLFVFVFFIWFLDVSIPFFPDFEG